MGDITTIQRDLKQMHMTITDVKVIFSVYIGLMIFGVVIVGKGIFDLNGGDFPERNAIIYGAAMSLAGTSIFYIRKLYRALINETFTFVESGNALTIASRVKRIGTIAFFIFRPAFGIVFSIVLYSIWRLSISASGAETIKTTSGFLYTTISIGFLSGFLAGRLLTTLEGYGARRLNTIVGGGE